MNKKQLKIAIILPSLSVGGAEKLVYEEVRYLSRNSQFVFEIHLLFDSGVLFDDFRALGVSVRAWNAPHNSPKMLLTYLRLINYLRQNQFDILHCHLLNGLGPLVGRLACIPSVMTTVHTDKKFGWFEMFSLRRNHIVIACGERVAGTLSKFIQKNRIRVLINAIAPPELNKQKDFFNSYNISNKIILGSIGSLGKQKGFDILISAFCKVKKQYSDILLFIAGEGKERNSLANLIAELKLSDSVYLLGNIKNIHSILPFVDIYINSSRREGLPLTLIEAMSHGIPMIATDVGGNSEVVIDGKTGLLVQPESSSDISRAICRLAENLSIRKQFGREAFNLFSKKYTIDRHCFVLSKIYSCRR